MKTQIFHDFFATVMKLVMPLVLVYVDFQYSLVMLYSTK